MVSTGCPIAFIPLLVGSALLHTSRLCELPQTVPRRARCRAVRTHGSGLRKYFRLGQFCRAVLIICFRSGAFEM